MPRNSLSESLPAMSIITDARGYVTCVNGHDDFAVSYEVRRLSLERPIRVDRWVRASHCLPRDPLGGWRRT